MLFLFRVRVRCFFLGFCLGLEIDLHFAVLVSVLQSAFMQLLSACGEREREIERVDAISDLVPLDEALGAEAVPPGTYCQTPQCHLVERPRPRGLPD